MSTVRVGGIRFKIYPQDHEPRHVHALIGSGEVIIDLRADGSVTLATRAARYGAMPKTTHKTPVSDRQIDAAIAAARRRSDPHAISAHYDRAADRIVVDFDNGNALHIARQNLQGLEDATAAELNAIVIEGPGTGLHWPRLDVDHYLLDIVRGVFGTRSWMAALGRSGGAVTTEAKAAAARRNGKRGGRPAQHG